MDKNSDDVLAELKLVGAVGRPPKAPVPLVVEVEKVVPVSVEPLDTRGEVSIQAIDAAIAELDDAMRGLEATRETLVHLRRMLEPEQVEAENPVEAPETPQSAAKKPEGVPVPSDPERAVAAIQEPVTYTPDEIARAREAARRKILGEDLPPEQRAMLEEDNTPFVGQVRAHLPGQEPEEITIGTVGTIKPSFPVEE